MHTLARSANTDTNGPWPGRTDKLLIYGLFQKGRVLAQDATRFVDREFGT